MESIGSRLRSERERLGYRQPDFAALAGQSKQSQIRYEAGERSPDGDYLAAIAAAGADVLYIITGRLTTDRPDNAATQIEEQLAAIRRDLLDPSRRRLPDESLEAAEKRVLTTSANSLRAILQHDLPFVAPETADEVEQLLDIATNSASLALYRAADFAQHRARRRQLKEELQGWVEGGPYFPGDAVTGLLTTLALEYAVPVKFLAELVEEIGEDITRKESEAETIRNSLEPRR